MTPVIADRLSYSKLTLMDLHPSDRALFPSAQRTIRSFQSSSQHSSGSMSELVFPPLLARPVLGHTVKELLHSRGLKSRSVGSIGIQNPGSSSPIDSRLSAALARGGPRSYPPLPPCVNPFSDLFSGFLCETFHGICSTE